MSNNSIVEHRGSYFYIEFREEYLAICLKCSYKKPITGKVKCKASPYCKALILAILESWTNDKRGKGQDLAIYMTYPQWIDAMYGMFGRNVIIDSLDELVGEGLVSREKHKMYGKDTYKYRLNYQELNRRIKDLPERDPKQTRPLVNASTSKRDNSENASTSKRVSDLQVNDDPSISGRNIESTKKPNIDNLSSDRLATPVANVPTDLSSLSDQERIAYYAEEIRKLEEKNIEHLFTSQHELSTPVEKQTSSVSPIAKPPTKTVEPKTTRKTSRTRNTEPLEQKSLPELQLSEKAQQVWNVWLEMPWNKGIPPKLTETAAKHCEKLSQVEISQDIIFKVLNFAKKNDRTGFYKGKSWELGHVVSEYSRWKSTQYQIETQEKQPEKQVVTVGNRHLQRFK